ncbi:winged helix DNA-binding protein [Erythrobacter neustonensis]|uniref:HTH marR-type domain-containing protein n=1 Tax=Erythrobacter neustonensis TaxID=1112 RepID=A0A192D448_9SPHN|nr:winged helix DNA-binding protein [Erythrobacter neustonensis]ANK12885.1 hypothetical protein A9D12_07920 [Erythrobacter neustonensis]
MSFFHAAGRKNHQKTSSASKLCPETAGVIPTASNRLGLGANDGIADDFITLAENWQGPDGEPILPKQSSIPPDLALDALTGQISAGQMRQLGLTLLKLADAIGDNRGAGELHSSSNWLTKEGRIERDSLRLAQVAAAMRATAHRRRRHLAAEWFGEPAWEMLLELFIQFAGGARVSTKSLAIASGAPDTTALRIMDRLEAASLIEREPSQTDKRVTLVSLTREGVIAVGSALMDAEV